MNYGHSGQCKTNELLKLIKPYQPNDVYKNLEGYNPTKKRKVIRLFDYV